MSNFFLVFMFVSSVAQNSILNRILASCSFGISGNVCPIEGCTYIGLSWNTPMYWATRRERVCVAFRAIVEEVKDDGEAKRQQDFRSPPYRGTILRLLTAVCRTFLRYSRVHTSERAGLRKEARKNKINNNLTNVSSLLASAFIL